MRQSAKYQVIIIILESLIISSTSTISIREQLRTSILRNIIQTSPSREKRRTASYRNSTEDSWSRWIYSRRYILIVKTLPFPYIKFIHYRHEKAFDSVVGWEAFWPGPVNVWDGSCCVSAEVLYEQHEQRIYLSVFTVNWQRFPYFLISYHNLSANCYCWLTKCNCAALQWWNQMFQVENTNHHSSHPEIRQRHKRRKYKNNGGNDRVNGGNYEVNTEDHEEIMRNIQSSTPAHKYISSVLCHFFLHINSFFLFSQFCSHLQFKLAFAPLNTLSLLIRVCGAFLC